MIGTSFYSGQGFGNQLWVYCSTRCIAEKRGLTFGFGGRETFKGGDFLDLDLGVEIIDGSKGPEPRTPQGFRNYYRERQIFEKHSGADISPFDPELATVPDGTFIDGTMQAEDYLLGFKERIQDWLAVEGQPFNGCVINIRGGEYKTLKDVFLARSYFQNAIDKVRSIDPQVTFHIVTDDLNLARSWFPDISVSSSGGVKRFWRFKIDPKSNLIGKDFSRLQHARFLILSNSSFSWWGAYTNKSCELVIAPKYWARHNVSDGYWSNGDSLTRGWLWLDRNGNFSDYETCKLELENYRNSPSN